MSARRNDHKAGSLGVRGHKSVRVVLLSVLAGVVVVAAIAAIIGIPIINSRAVAFYVDGTPILHQYVSAMVSDLPFDISSNYYNSRIGLANSSDPKTQYLITGLTNEAYQRLVIMVAESNLAAKQQIALTPSALDSAVDAYVKDHVTPGDSAQEQQLRTPAMRFYIQLREISKAYEDKLTENVTISPAEVKEYYDTWSWNYTDKAGHTLTIQQAGTKLVADALTNKKFHMVLQQRDQLLKSEVPLVNGDTRYKQFMRWWDIMFGISVPDSLQPLTVGAGS